MSDNEHISGVLRGRGACPGVDFSPPSGSRAWLPWLKHAPWFPEGAARGWRDIHRTWFGDADRPVTNFHLMGAAPRAWDERIRACYGPLLAQLTEGGLADWEETPQGCVAKLILADQLPRHMYRGERRAFLTDPIGLRLADKLAAAIAVGERLHVEEAFMIAWPWVHAEDLATTRRAEAWHTLLADAATGTAYRFRALVNRFGAERHVRVVERFGRYPHRNTMLERESTAEERHHLAHDADLWELQQSAAHGSFAYKLKAARFFARMAFTLVARGELPAIAHFTRACLVRAPRGSRLPLLED